MRHPDEGLAVAVVSVGAWRERAVVRIVHRSDGRHAGEGDGGGGAGDEEEAREAGVVGELRGEAGCQRDDAGSVSGVFERVERKG